MMDDLDIDTASAVDYNQEKSSDLWELGRLPFPFTEHSPSSESFAHLVAVLQDGQGLKVDGKLGPNTLEHLETSEVSTGSDSDTILVGGSELEPPEQLKVRNSEQSDLPSFDATPRNTDVRHLVIHESVSPTVDGTESTLLEEGHGVHLMIAPDGGVRAHNDLVEDRLAHAEELNASSVGLEIVNPYRPDWAQPPFDETIPARWWTWVPDELEEEKYVKPTDAQIDILVELVPWVCNQIDTLPLEFPTEELDASKTEIDGADDGAIPDPGVVAHQDFDEHGDGRWPLERLMERV